jgi:hypothetical protein
MPRLQADTTLTNDGDQDGFRSSPYEYFETAQSGGVTLVRTEVQVVYKAQSVPGTTLLLPSTPDWLDLPGD